MPIKPYPVSGKVYASNGSTAFPDVKVVLRNKTTNEEKTQTTNESGEFLFDLANFNSIYSTGDSLELRGELGSFYKEETTTLSGSSWEQNLTLGTAKVGKRIDLNLIEEELVVFLRNKVTDPDSRGSVKTDVFTADGSTVKFTLSESTGKNIHNVMVNNTSKTNYTDYYVDYKDKFTLSNPVIYILSPPSDGDIVEVKYTYGASWIYSDYPKLGIQESNYPRIRAEIISIRTEETGLNADYNLTDLMVETSVWSEKKNQINLLTNNLRDSIMRNKKGFHFFKLIVPLTVGPVLKSPERPKVFQRNSDYEIKFKLEKT